MPFTFKPSGGYAMPTSFGPLGGQKVIHYGDVTTLTLLYMTDKDALAALLPEPFQPADEPIVTVYCQVCRQVDFMAGGGYNVIGVNLSAIFNGKKDHFLGNYAAILWENDTIPIITGRELLGAPKSYADIPDPQQEGNDWRFHCSVYGARLVEGMIRKATPVNEASRREIERIAKERMWMGWKYIPKADWSGAEVSFPTCIPSAPTVDQAWLGEPSHRFFETSWVDSLYHSTVMQGLRTLILKEYRGGVVTRGSFDLLVGESRRLE
jgi:acetoacetate decarboxylase